MLCRLAVCPTRTSPLSVKATIDGVVRAPSAFSITFGLLPSITATQELVVPRSIPIALAMTNSFSLVLCGLLPPATLAIEGDVLRGGRSAGTRPLGRRIRRLP